MAKWYENDPVLEEAVGSATTPPAPESKPGKKNWYDSDTVIEPDKTKAKLIAGDALSRKDLQDMGVEEQTNAKQRKVIGDVIRRQPANRYAAAGMGGFSPDIRTEDVRRPEPVEGEKGRIGVVESVKRGGWEGILEHIPIPFNPFYGVQKAEYFQAKKRLDLDKRGQSPLTGIYSYSPPAEAMFNWHTPESDKVYVEKFEKNLTEEQKRGFTSAATVVGGVADILPWVADIATTSPARGTFNTFVTGAVKSKTLGGAIKLLGGAGISALGQPNRFSETYSDVKLQYPDLSDAKAGIKAATRLYIENLSEMTGELITKGTLVVGGAVLDKLPFTGQLMKRLQPQWMKITGGTAAEFAKKISTKTGIHGLYGEVGEEFLNDQLHAIFKTDDFGAGKDAGILERMGAAFQQDVKALPTMIPTLLAPVGAQYGLSKLAGRRVGQIEPPTRPQVSQADYEDALYNRLLQRAGAGDQVAIDKLNEMQQGAALPTYEDLLDRISQGDLSAAEEIQAGRYRDVQGKVGQTIQGEGVPGPEAARFAPTAAKKTTTRAKIVAPEAVAGITPAEPTVPAPQGGIVESPYIDLNPEQEITVETREGTEKMTVSNAIYELEDIEQSPDLMGENGEQARILITDRALSIHKELDKLISAPQGEIAAGQAPAPTKGKWRAPANMTEDQFHDWLYSKGTPSAMAGSFDFEDQWTYYQEQQAPAPEGKAYGAQNKGVTQAKYDAIKEKQKKGGKLKGGREAGGTILLSPEEWSDALQIGMYHLEAGARSFADWSKRVIDDFGEDITPHLPRLWSQIGGTPEPTQQGVAKPGGAIPPSEPDLGGIRGQLEESLTRAQQLTDSEIGIAYHQELSKRSAAYEVEVERLKTEEGKSDSEALREADRVFYGPLIDDPPTYEPPNLTPDQWEGLSRRIQSGEVFTPGAEAYTKRRAQEALDKHRAGKRLQDGEVKILRRLAGIEVPDSSRDKRHVVQYIMDIAGLWKLGAGADVQMRRQMNLLRARHPALFAKAVTENLRAYGSQVYADKLNDRTMNAPRHKQAVDYGAVFLERAPKPGERTEQYMSRVASKLPLIKQAMRGFVDAFNAAQQSLWDYKMDQWERKGIKITPKMMEALADFNNTFLGMSRAKTKFGKSLSTVGSIFMWSPTLTWSRVKAPFTVFTNPVMRGEAAGSFATFISSGYALMAVAAVLGALLRPKQKPVEWNHTSSDFGKGRLGFTRFEAFGDYGTYVRAFWQSVLGEQKTQAGHIVDQPRTQPFVQLMRNKRSAFIGFLEKIRTRANYFGGPAWGLPNWEEMKKEGKTKAGLAAIGEKVTASKAGKVGYLATREVVNTFLPFFVNSAVEAAWNDGFPVGLLAGVDEFFSGSTVSYKPTEGTKLQLLQDAAANLKHKKMWEDLTETQQNQLRRDVPEIKEGEFKLGVERANRVDYEYIGRIVDESKAVGREIKAVLKPEVRKALDQSTVSLGISRKLGDWILNDNRFELYQDYAAQEIDRLVSNAMSRNKKWPTLTPMQKSKILGDAVNQAKENARAKVRRFVNTVEQAAKE